MLSTQLFEHQNYIANSSQTNMQTQIQPVTQPQPQPPATKPPAKPPSPIAVFNQQFLAFLDDIIIVFPEDSDIKYLRKMVADVQKKNVKIIPTMWRNCVVRFYKKTIMEGNIDYFIQKKYDADLENAGITTGNILDLNTIIDRLRGPIAAMSNANKTKTMHYMRNLTVISELINPIHDAAEQVVQLQRSLQAQPQHVPVPVPVPVPNTLNLNNPKQIVRLVPQFNWQTFANQLIQERKQTCVECGGFPDCFYHSVLHQLRTANILDDATKSELNSVAALRVKVAQHIATLPSDQLSPIAIELSLASGIKFQPALFGKHGIDLKPKPAATAATDAPKTDETNKTKDSDQNKPDVGENADVQDSNDENTCKRLKTEPALSADADTPSALAKNNMHISNLTTDKYAELVADGLFGGDIEIGAICKMFNVDVEILCEHQGKIISHRHYCADKPSEKCVFLAFHLFHYRSVIPC